MGFAKQIHIRLEDSGYRRIKAQWIDEKTRHAKKHALLYPPGKELVKGESPL